jgi:phosphoribosylaminoimidazole carboxylase PurE protein
MKKMKVAIIMGSDSDWPTMKEAAKVLKTFKISFDKKVVSAHRTPKLMYDFSKSAHRNYSVIIAGAGGAAHLPGMVASLTQLPVIGVPVTSKSMDGLDSLLSIAQMPKGIPVATVAVGNAYNAGLLAARILATTDPQLFERLQAFSRSLVKSVKKMKI